MGGIVAAVGPHSREADFPAALDSLKHHRSFRSAVYVSTEFFRLGAVFRENDPPSSAWNPELGAGAVVYGFACDHSPVPVRTDAESVLRRYIRGGIEEVCTVDGSFSLAIVDLRRSQLFIVNDRTATIPHQYLTIRGTTGIAPEAKALFNLMSAPAKLGLDGALMFLSIGHGVAHQTLFEGVHLLEPAQVLSVSLKTGEIKTATYWSLRFESDPRMKERQAADELFKALGDSHEAAVADRPAPMELLLTGGFDSRAVLGFLAKTGWPPSGCLTWGVDDSIPFSDPVIASSVARDAGAAWKFLDYDGEAFSEFAREWAIISELGSDNLGSFAAGADFLIRGREPAEAVVIGDQILGSAGLPLSRADAIETAAGVPRDGLSVGLRSFLRSPARETVGGAVKAHLQAVADRCENDAPRDLQDFLNFHIRLARWLNAPNYFREPMVSPRRPMLLGPVLGLLRHFPPGLRVEKRALVAMLNRHFPALMVHPRASANSLVDWLAMFSGDGPCAPRFQVLLNAPALLDGPLAEVLDADAVRRVASAFASRRRSSISRAPAPERRLPGLRRAAGHIPVAGAALRAVERGWRVLAGRGSGASVERVAMRLALISLFMGCIEDGEFTARGGRSSRTREINGLWRVQGLPGQPAHH